MQEKPKILRQDKKAVILSYAVYRVWLAATTYGILAVYDYLSYKNTKLSVYQDSLKLTTGALAPDTQTIKFEDITAFSAEQSSIGKMGDYGKVKIHHKDNSTYSLKFIHAPQRIVYVLQKKASLVNPHVLAPDTYAQKFEEVEQRVVKPATREAIPLKQAAVPVCGRCGSDRLQAVTDIRTTGFNSLNATSGCCCLGPWGMLCGLFGSGRTSSKTRRMCLNCGKKF